MPDRIDAQRRVDQIRAFREELAALKVAGRSPLGDEQEAALTDYHDRLLARLAAEFDVDRSRVAGQLSRGMRLASFFGAVALTAAIYSLVDRFWGGLDLPEQTLLLVAFPVVSLFGVEFAARRERTLYVASLFALVAYGTFWLAVGVLGWELNIPLTPVYIWAGVIFGFALALPYRFRLVLAIALAALATAMAASMFAVADVPWPEIFSRLDLLMTAGFSLLLLALPLGHVDRSLAPVVRVVAFAIGLASLLVLSSSGSSSAMPIDGELIEHIYQGIMLVVCVSGLYVAVRQGWTETVAIVSVAFALFLFVRYVDWFWDLLPRFVFFLLLAGLAFVWLFALRRMRGRLAEARR